MEDVIKLIQVLKRLVKEGHSVIVIEHHLHMLASCDWLIELGPGGGENGGTIIGTGRPEDISSLDTPTSRYLKEVIKK